MKKRSFYILISALCVLSYIWLFLNVYSAEKGIAGNLNVCIFKSITSIPCPACGTTSSVISLTEADFVAAIIKNPFGLIAAVVLVLVPFWLLRDLFFRQASMHSFYVRTEHILKNRYVAASLIVAVMINWIWNIMKAL